MTVTYAIRCGDFVKVGKTRDLATRISSMQTGCPLPLVLHGYVEGDIEAATHEYLEFCGHERVRGEWFAFDDEITYALAGMGIWPLDLRERAEWRGELVGGWTGSL